MKKTKYLILFLFLSFFITIPVYALESGYIDDYGVIPYGGHSTHQYVVYDNDGNPHQGFCVEPDKTTTTGEFHEKGKSINDLAASDARWAALLKMIYYAFGNEGWNDTIAQQFTSAFHLESFSGDDLKKQYYAYSHVLLSFYYNEIKPGGNGWDTGMDAGEKAAAGGLANDFISGLSAPPSNFKAYVVNYENSQDIIYSEYKSGVCGVVVKRKKNISTGNCDGSLQSGAKFKLYTGCTNTTTGAGCTEVAGSEKTTGATGSVKWTDLDENTTYYYHETQAPNGFYLDRPGYYVLNKSESCPSNTTCNSEKQYCYKVRKIDKNKKAAGSTTPLSGFTFKDSLTNNTEVSGNDGYAVFLTGNDKRKRNVTESAVPAGYEKSNASVEVTPTEMTYNSNGTYNAASCNAEPIVFENYKYVINWFKEYEQEGRKADGAEFVVKNSSGKYITVWGSENIKDASGVTKKCWIYNGTTNNRSDASVFVSGENGDPGGVCLQKVPEGTYTVVETSPAPNHAYSNDVYKTIDASTSFNTNKIFKNKPTEVEVTKVIKDDDSAQTDAFAAIFAQLEALQLKKIKFQVYKLDANGNKTGNALEFVYHDGVYDLKSAADVDGTATTTVQLDDNKKIKFRHLEWGQYTLVEDGSDGSCRCEGETDCVGYYFPDGSSKFTVTKCSNASSPSAATVNAATAETTCTAGGLVNVNVENHPTYLWFTKKDFYEYEESDDVVDFVDDGERSAFDGITFKVKDENGNYLEFVEVGTHVTDNSKVCLSDTDYREYRYITAAEKAALGSAINNLTITSELHTCGGHIRITNLCRGKTFTVEEVSVPEDSVFVLENSGSLPSATYTIPCCEDDTTKTTSTKLIEDKGTRVRFEKRDSKYNHLINDETTTFQVYQCEKGVDCHPTDNAADMTAASGVRKIMKFRPRAKLTRKDQNIPIEYDEEDGGDNGSVIKHTDQLKGNDKDYESSYEVYKAASDSDIAKGGTFVTDLNPDHGVLILRYLPSGYNYVLVETVAPQGYSLPKGRNAETKFNITTTTVKVEETNVPNKPVSLLVRKYDQNGNLLEGATFKLHEAQSCNFNVKPNKVPTNGVVKLKTIRDGIYEARNPGDTETFKTCQDKPGAPCSDINNTLTNSIYDNTVGDFDTYLNERNENVHIEAGEALIQYLTYGKCYIIEEVKAPTGYSLPEKEEDRFVMVKITDKEQVFDTFEELINKPTPFTFYKYDEYNKPIDGAKFKLQKLDDNKVYHDVPVTKVTGEDGNFYYKMDSSSSNYIIETTGGKATVYYLEEGQYRILEVEAPAGYELPKKTINAATFFVDEKGKVYGSNIIANKPKTEKTTTKPQAQATLVVNIQTGQVIVKYGLIFAVLVLAIAGLIYVQRKNKK